MSSLYHDARRTLLNQRIQLHEDGTKEYWRDVPGYNGLYRVSDLGRVKSVKRVIVEKTGKRRLLKGKVIRSWFNNPSKGDYHVIVGLCKNGKPQSFPVGVLVLIAFKGPRPLGKECCHNDGNPKNNKADNLRWDTRKGNLHDCIAHGTNPQGTRNAHAKLTDDKVRAARSLYFSRKKLMRQIAKMFGVNVPTIHNAIHGKTWKHVV